MIQTKISDFALLHNLPNRISRIAATQNGPDTSPAMRSPAAETLAAHADSLDVIFSGKG
jgi:hypothetical protein